MYFLWKDDEMLAAFINSCISYIDTYRLSYFRKKEDQVVEELAYVQSQCVKLKKIIATLAETKRSHRRQNFELFQGRWIDKKQAESELAKAEKRAEHLVREEYERYGNACARLQRRMTTREVRLVASGFDSRST